MSVIAWLVSLLVMNACLRNVSITVLMEMRTGTGGTLGNVGDMPLTERTERKRLRLSVIDVPGILPCTMRLRDGGELQTLIEFGRYSGTGN